MAPISTARAGGGEIQGCKTDQRDLPGCRAERCESEGSRRTPAALEGCILDVSPQAQAKSASLNAKLDAHQAWISSDGKTRHCAVLDGEDLRPLHKLFAGRQLTGLSARRTIAIGIDFSKCELQGAKFDGADLREANFSHAELSGASLRAAKLAHAKFQAPSLEGSIC